MNKMNERHEEPTTMLNFEQIASIRHPEALKHLNGAGNEPASFGCNQSWYRESFQQMAGCGPCAATNLIQYSSQQQILNTPNMLLPDFIEMMHQVWSYVTPGLMGVHKAQQLANGINRFAAEHHLPIRTVRLDIPIWHINRPSQEKIIQFISDGLNEDSPVAFLNLSNGKLIDLESWHWVTITELYRNSQGHYFVDIANYGIMTRIDLTSWLNSTLLGGGFVFCRTVTD
jgi:hypothetical protein